jgi:SAM-dependent methyltransferase
LLDDNYEQREFWKKEFGDEYIERNNSLEYADSFYKKATGHTKSEIFENSFSSLGKNLKILELGCNIGINLEILKKLGFQNLYGLEINEKAIEIAKIKHPDTQFFHGSIEEFDFDILRPGNNIQGMAPRFIDKIEGKNAKKDYVLGEGILESE